MNSSLQDHKPMLNRLKLLRKKINYDDEDKDIKKVLEWLNNKRSLDKSTISMTTLDKLSDWEILSKKGIVQHTLNKKYFFSLKGLIVKHAKLAEVESWNQPIITQNAGGYLIILCQEKDSTIKFLIQAKFEAGNINKIQLGPTIQATTSNLLRHHGGRKVLFSEYVKNTSNLIYSAQHSEDGSRFWHKNNVNSLILLNKNEVVESNDNFIWLTLSQIKKLMLYDHVVNTFVKTILAPL